MPDDLYADDIPWRFGPVPASSRLPVGDPSTPDLLGMMTADMLALEAHLASVTDDLTITRDLVKIALDQITALTTKVAQRDATILDQSQQIRALLDRDLGQGR